MRGNSIVTTYYITDYYSFQPASEGTLERSARYDRNQVAQPGLKPGFPVDKTGGRFGSLPVKERYTNI